MPAATDFAPGNKNRWDPITGGEGHAIEFLSGSGWACGEESRLVPHRSDLFA